MNLIVSLASVAEHVTSIARHGHLLRLELRVAVSQKIPLHNDPYQGQSSHRRLRPNEWRQVKKPVEILLMSLPLWESERGGIYHQVLCQVGGGDYYYGCS